MNNRQTLIEQLNENSKLILSKLKMAEIKLERIDLSNTKKPPRTSTDGPAAKPARKGKISQKVIYFKLHF
jgi:hypothetical protein